MSTILILALLLAAPPPPPTSPTSPTSPSTTTAPAAAAVKDEELIEHYVAAAEAAQKRYADEVGVAKKVRDERLAKAEKALAAERQGATQKYVASAEKSAARYADAMKTAIAATIAAYDGMIERTRRAGQADASAAAAEAKKAFAARALEDNRRNTAAARALAGITTGPGGEPATTTTTTTTTATVERGPVIADHIVAAVDDFIIDVYHNGEKVPDTSRRLLNEIHGATVERIDVEIRRGDWVVFNCANNRLRWGGQSLFIAAGLLNEGAPPAFVSKENDPHWSACDNPSQVKKFIADRLHLSDQPARAPESPWGEGIGQFNSQVPNSEAQPIWGESRNTWIKFIAE